MTKSRDEANAAVIKRLRARLERKSRGATAEADAQLRAQVDFFARLRTVLFVNVDSLGTTALDDTALAVLANDASLPSGIRCPAVLLPDPSGMDIEPAPKHDLFALPEVPTAAGKRSASQSADDKRTPVTKKQRTFARPHQYSLDLPATCPPDIQRDVEKLVQTAASQGKTPPRYAYQWVGQRACRIRTLQVKIAKQLKDGSYAAVIDEKPFQRKEQNDGDSDYADDDDVFTVQPPAPPIDAKEIEDDDEGESEEKPPGLSPTQDEEPEDQEHGEADQEDRAEDDEGGRNSDNPDTSNDDKKSSASDDKGDSSPKGSSKKKYFHSSSSK
ncbi:hypothetical protein PF003_g30538 [Phytophthora fragariae]|nr:hypothetical protein PF003_g30538 [Phytophthora fragariae]